MNCNKENSIAWKCSYSNCDYKADKDSELLAHYHFGEYYFSPTETLFNSSCKENNN